MIINIRNHRPLHFAVTLFLLLSFSGCCKVTLFTSEEIDIIERDTAQVMKIYTIDNPDDILTLRALSYELSAAEIASDHYKLLVHRMLQTVSDSTIDGVGIAAPQIGINRRIIAVQRFDKPNAPFEVFPNINIREYSQDTTFSEEGCLSVPGKNGKTVRSKWVIVSYTNTLTMLPQADTIKGFTAIIFQHEIDHLDGVIYTDSIRRVD